MNLGQNKKIILLTLEYNSDEKMIAGRTLLQKTLYFLNTILNLGIDFVPYYYGPYSTEIANELEEMVTAGLVDEMIKKYPPIDFGGAYESRLHIYCLSSYGKKIVNDIKINDSELADKIKEIMSKIKQFTQASDYKSLSIAAKMHYLLNSLHKPITVDEIIEEARELGWKINKDEAKEALNFLVGLELVVTGKGR